ncbi:TM2 domain-containing protein [Qipengyuania sp. GH1]|uniref:TM2 domain-containing protein n=1 Tax=Qipengyuania aestuarii TaxID=2867241 RepID=UPI001C8776C0|nr:TM2 domain-containing protein [Qipengyuania aestuarii]MBX7534458.1 TM2 domain-containing protein [Qipengyuania aestuarii]
MSTDSNNLANARAQMMYDANRRSTGVAYLLAIFLGGLGAHRFYLGYPGTGAVQLVLWVLGWPTAGLFWIPLGIWILIDLFLIPGMARKKNMEIADKFGE